MNGCAFLFPGQASQFVGMGKDLYEAFPQVRELYEQTDELLGFPLSRLCFEGPEEELRKTQFTQPAVFAHSVAVWRLLEEANLTADFVAGHSLGEYSALVAAGAIKFEVAIELVKRRAELMEQAGVAKPGTMAAVIGMEDEQVIQLCSQESAPAGTDGVVVAANFNAPGQVVVSGDLAAVGRFGERAKKEGARRVVPLAVGGAFHSPLMSSAAKQMKGLLMEAAISDPTLPVVTNVGAAPVLTSAELREQLIGQITHPVRWTDTIRCLVRQGIDRALEVGPGSVLQGLVRRIDRDLTVTAVGSVTELRNLGNLAGCGMAATDSRQASSTP